METTMLGRKGKAMSDLISRRALLDDIRRYQRPYNVEFLISTQPAIDPKIFLRRLSPCDLCCYNPPSSTDGKPCIMCPASRRT